MHKFIVSKTQQINYKLHLNVIPKGAPAKLADLSWDAIFIFEEKYIWRLAAKQKKPFLE